MQCCDVYVVRIYVYSILDAVAKSAVSQYVMGPLYIIHTCMKSIYAVQYKIEYVLYI